MTKSYIGGEYACLDYIQPYKNETLWNTYIHSLQNIL